MDRPVVHFIMSVNDGKANLPLLLSGLPLGSSESRLGSRVYTQPPQAVFFGGGYDENAVEQLRSTVRLTNGTRKVPWLRADMEETAAGPTPGTKEYARSVALRIKTVLRILAEDGKLDGNNDSVYFW